MRRWRLDDNDVQMDENGLLCDDIDAAIAMCNALSDNHDARAMRLWRRDATVSKRRWQSDNRDVIIAMQQYRCE